MAHDLMSMDQTDALSAKLTLQIYFQAKQPRGSSWSPSRIQETLRQDRRHLKHCKQIIQVIDTEWREDPMSFESNKGFCFNSTLKKVISSLTYTLYNNLHTYTGGYCHHLQNKMNASYIYE